MKKRILQIHHLLLPVFEIIVNLSLIPFYFIKLFHEVGMFPSSDPATPPLRKDYYYSAYDNLHLDDSLHLMYVSLAIIALSILSAGLALIFKINKTVCLAAAICFAISLLAFAYTFYTASCIWRAY